jgi:hypothetical protein
MCNDSQLQLLSELQRLLDEQNELARQGKLSEVEGLCERTSGIVEEISRCGIFKSDKFSRERKRLARSYESLRLALSNQRDEVGREMDRIRKGRRTIGVYRDSIQAARK